MVLKLIGLAFLIFLLDLPWLSLVGGNYNAIIQAIQGGKEVRMRPLAGIIVYPALAFLALKTQSLKDAFLTGMSVYAVYDFTVLAAFKEYPFYMAVADTVWGGALFTAVFWIRTYFGIKM
jgi:uncharacterized membrane protein